MRYHYRIWVGLCSLGARRKSRFLVLGAAKRRFFGAPKKKKKRRLVTRPSRFFWGGGRKKNWGVEKVIWPPNTITRRRRKKKKKKKIRLGAENYGFKRRFFRAPKKKKNADWSPAQAGFVWRGAEKKNWRVEKVTWPPNTITRRRGKKKKTRFFRLGPEKYDFRAPKEQRPRYGTRNCDLHFRNGRNICHLTN